MAAKSPPRPRRAFLAEERRMVEALARCTFLPGSFEKRFARTLEGQAAREDGTLTDAQALCLRRLVYRFRRQIRPDVVRLAAPDGPPPEAWAWPPRRNTAAAPGLFE